VGLAVEFTETFKNVLTIHSTPPRTYTLNYDSYYGSWSTRF